MVNFLKGYYNLEQDGNGSKETSNVLNLVPALKKVSKK
jgi:hypothetical protein